MNKKQQLFSEFFQTMTRMRKLINQTATAPIDQRIATMLQTRAMEYIEQNSGLTAGELAAHLQMSSSAVTQLMDRLSDAGLVAREHGQIDRRAVHFSLTQTGKKYLEESLAIIKEKTSKILSPMPERDLKEVIRIFNNILQYHEQ